MARRRARRRGRPAARARRAPGRRSPARAGARWRAAARAVDARARRARWGCGRSAEQPLYDLCIVGGGPAGLAAAVYAASEGLQDRGRRARGARWPGRPERVDRELPRLPQGTVRRRPHAPGGRPGRAVRRRDGAGPRRRRARDARPGPRGAASTAPARSRRGRCSSRPGCRTGGSRRPGSTRSTGRGVYYGATASEAASAQGDEVYVVGAANSAGQAALNLARYAKRVVLVVRGARRSRTRCRSYLVERIRAADNIEVRLRSRGRRRPRRRSPRGDHAGRPRHGTRRRCRRAGCSSSSAHLRAPTGSAPTSLRDDKGFVITGPELLAARTRRAGRWRGAPFALETSVPGRVRRRRRAAGLHEAGGVGGRRGRDGGLPRPPLPGDDVMQPRRICARCACSTGSTTSSSPSWSRRRPRCRFEPGETLFLEGAARRLLVGAARGQHRPRPRTSGARRRCSGRWTRPGSGPAGSAPGTSTASTWRPVAALVAGRVLRVPARRAARAGRATWFPFGVHIIEGLFATARTHRVDRPAAGGAGRARHARRRAGARDQQPGRGRDPGRRRARGRVRDAAVVARAARRRRR